MNFAWCTDIHVNFLKQTACETFYDTLKQADGVLISGDIDEAPEITTTLIHMANYIQKPIYFVLGNHDYYNGSVATVREQMSRVTRDHEFIHYLGEPYVHYVKNTLIAGVDGWADTRYGNVHKSGVTLNDERYISELRNHITTWNYGIPGQVGQWDKRKELADVDARSLYEKVTEGIQQSFRALEQVIILTHIPPFPEASKHRGIQSDDHYLPFYASQATGDVLRLLAEENPDHTFLVLCGHTHGAADVQITSNLRVKAGESQYYEPCIQELIAV